MSLLLALALLQVPGDAWTSAQAPPREVKLLYWDVLQTTDVWVRIVPEGLDGNPPRVELVFKASFPGKQKRDPYSGLPRWPTGEPERLTLSAQILPRSVVGELSLELVIDGTSVDLTGKARQLGCPPPSLDCGVTGVEAEIDASLLESLIAARNIQGRVLGFPVELVEADQRALAELGRRTGLSEGDEAKSPH